MLSSSRAIFSRPSRSALKLWRTSRRSALSLSRSRIAAARYCREAERTSNGVAADSGRRAERLSEKSQGEPVDREESCDFAQARPRAQGGQQRVPGSGAPAPQRLQLDAAGFQAQAVLQRQLDGRGLGQHDRLREERRQCAEQSQADSGRDLSIHQNLPSEMRNARPVPSARPGRWNPAPDSAHSAPVRRWVMRNGPLQCALRPRSSARIAR